MKKKIISMLCIFVSSFTIMTSCSIREEDYEQAIVNEWELEKFTRRAHFYIEKSGTFEWGKKIYSDFEEPIRISFKSDGTYIYSQGTEIHRSNDYKWFILADCLNLGTTPYLVSNVYCHFEVTECSSAYQEDHVKPYYSLGENMTIEQLTRTKLVLFQGDESGEFERFVFKKI